jgi:RNA-binding protein 26
VERRLTCDQGIGEYTDLESTPEKTFITFKDRFTAEKFMYGTTNGEIPSAGKVEMAWVQTPLPPVNLSNKPTSVAKPEPSDAMHTDEGDAMAQDSSPMLGSGHGQEQQELDYDVADDNDWIQ